MASAAFIALDAPSTATINDLPDDLLGRVLALAGRRERRPVTAVCRTCRRVFYSEPALWRFLRLGSYLWSVGNTDDAIIAQLPLLQLVAGVLQRLTIRCQSGSLMADALSSLQPTNAGIAAQAQQWSALTGLELWSYHIPSVPPAVLGAMPRLSSLATIGVRGRTSAELGQALLCLSAQLTHLELRSGQVTAEVAAAVGTLSKLCILKLRSDSFKPALARALAQLPALAALWMDFEMEYERDDPDPNLAAAASEFEAAVGAGSLRRLGCLRLSLDAVAPDGLVAALAQLTQLTSLELQAGLNDVRQLTSLARLCRLSLCDHSEVAGDAPQLPQPSAFPALLTYNFCFQNKPFQLSDTGVQLSSCSYDCDCIGSVFEDSDLTLPMAHRGSWHELATITDCPAQGVLSVGRPDGLQSLDHLLHALVPPEAPLRTLCLQTDLPPAALLGCTRIAALHCLNGPEPGILSALPLELPHLTSLHLTGTAPATGLRPDQLPSLPALLELQLARCIDSSGGSAIDACMPALLSQAPQLTSLSVWGHLSHEDAEALEGPLPPPAWLASLQGVRELCLWHNRLGALLPGPYLEGLESLSLAYNVFERLPRCLAAATSLTQLSLSGNSSLTLTAEYVDQVLARMPGLRQLHVDSCPPAMEERLWQALPDLKSSLKIQLDWDNFDPRTLLFPAFD